jgi:hypothetical protein
MGKTAKVKCLLCGFATLRLCTLRLCDFATLRLCDFATLRLCDFAALRVGLLSRCRTAARCFRVFARLDLNSQRPCN